MRILITGANSFIGTSFKRWMSGHVNYSVDTIDMESSKWKDFDFSVYDSILHVAGIAHADTSKVSEETKELYYQVNSTLTYEVAKKAKESGVKQFIFMSSIIVYGEVKNGRELHITKKTAPNPSNFYGDSKWQAEKKLMTLADSTFKIAILRPPMIYGPFCKGNYLQLSKIARKTKFFPVVNNKRSVLYIDNLCEFIRLIVEHQDSGTFFPQNEDFISTSYLVQAIARSNGRKIIMLPLLTPIIKMITLIPGKVGKLASKAFGSVYYDQELSEYKSNYRVKNFAESIQSTEKKN